MTPIRRRRGVVMDPVTVAAIRQAHAQGIATREIAKTLGVAASTVYNHTRGNRRVPCPKCGVPVAPISNQCRRCRGKSLMRNGWLDPKPRQDAIPGGAGSGGGQVDASRVPGGAADALGLAKTPFWVCAGSPTGAHEWKLDSECLGVCVHCDEVRQHKTWFSNYPAA